MKIEDLRFKKRERGRRKGEGRLQKAEGRRERGKEEGRLQIADCRMKN